MGGGGEGAWVGEGRDESVRTRKVRRALLPPTKAPQTLPFSTPYHSPPNPTYTPPHTCQCPPHTLHPLIPCTPSYPAPPHALHPLIPCTPSSLHMAPLLQQQVRQLPSPPPPPSHHACPAHGPLLPCRQPEVLQQQVRQRAGQQARGAAARAHGTPARTHSVPGEGAARLTQARRQAGMTGKIRGGHVCVLHARR